MKVDLKLTGKNFAPDLKHLNCQEVDKQHFAIQNGSSIIGLPVVVSVYTPGIIFLFSCACWRSKIK